MLYGHIYAIVIACYTILHFLTHKIPYKFEENHASSILLYGLWYHSATLLPPSPPGMKWKAANGRHRYFCCHTAIALLANTLTFVCGSRWERASSFVPYKHSLSLSQSVKSIVFVLPSTNKGHYCAQKDSFCKSP